MIYDIKNLNIIYDIKIMYIKKKLKNNIIMLISKI